MNAAMAEAGGPAAKDGWAAVWARDLTLWDLKGATPVIQAEVRAALEDGRVPRGGAGLVPGCGAARNNSRVMFGAGAAKASTNAAASADNTTVKTGRGIAGKGATDRAWFQAGGGAARTLAAKNPKIGGRFKCSRRAEVFRRPDRIFGFFSASHHRRRIKGGGTSPAPLLKTGLRP